MFSVRSIATFSLFVTCAACNGEFSPDANVKQLQDYSMQNDGVEVLDVNGTKVILAEESPATDMSLLSSQFNFEVEKIVVVASVEQSNWTTVDEYPTGLPYSAEEMMDELSTSGEEELSLMTLDIEQDLISTVDFAIESGAQIVFIAVDDSTIDAVEVIHSSY